eukprot:TRINITY_DN9827_c0_g1_i1.p1 TRINITY_DN9827_c0_g1~~TRINITY_DN9827_c0_g1_i1.p1  ORF type:complete len:549 (+),score=59.15 TRINITY_DN9827_c0_g1_i1:226-1872(+)
MAREVEMKDASDDPKAGKDDAKAGKDDKAADGKKDDGKPPVKKIPETPAEVLAELQAQRPLIERAVVTREVRLMARAIRQMMALRRKLRGSILTAFVRQNLPGESEARKALLAALAKVDTDMDADAAPSLTADAATAAPAAPAAAADGAAAAAPAADAAAAAAPPAPVRPTSLPEVEMFATLMALILLIDRKANEEAKELSWAAVRRLQSLNRRTVDLLGARVLFYFSLAHERTNSLQDIRSTLLALNQTATLRHNEIGQEMLLNLLLRNYLAYNLYDQAEKLRTKAVRPETHSNQQLCRYLFFLGRIRAIQLEYSEAKDCLQQASRKAPSAALGFRVECAKWHVLVRLLLGEIPERSLFVAAGMRKPLRPYFELTNAVRVGNLELFRSVASRYAADFARDRTANLIVRLRHNVIRTALRRISLAYSRIALADVAAKLHLTGDTAVADAECIVAKAIRDGGIDAVIDHQAGHMVSRETGDVYMTLEPQAAFHSRIAYCLNLHNEAVKAMQFPPSARKGEADAEEKRRERMLVEQELAQHIAEEGDDDF